MAWANEEVENHCDCFFVNTTGATWSARGAISAFGVAIPRPPGYVPGADPAAQLVEYCPTAQANGSEACVTVADCPDSRLVIPETSHPPRTCPVIPRWSAKKGS